MSTVQPEREGGGVTTVEVPPLVLASRSPRRVQLLEMLGLDFEVLPAGVDETAHPASAPAEIAEYLAREKALAVASLRPDALVIGCDTLVVIDGETLGKPKDEADAVRMLLRLEGREHRVETGIAVVAPGGRLESSVEGIRVRFRPFDRQMAEDYVATGEPLDKAGAYGIQGSGAALVDWIEGDFFAVMGLPIARMMSLFRALGWRYNFRGFEPLP
ncbi:MAG TPA: nucleoside triphosphate pyrophosphatase [Longimicrobiales bacterium]